MLTSLEHRSTDQDITLLDVLSGPALPASKPVFARRDADLDPLMLAAALASGPHVTRNHYHHDFFPGIPVPQPEAHSRGEDVKDTANGTRDTPYRLTYVSRQAPRSIRTRSVAEAGKENDAREASEVLKSSGNLPTHKKRYPPSSKQAQSPRLAPLPVRTSVASSNVAIDVKCMARTRIPTAHGPVFLHLYRNNRDEKEHLAIVVDPAQFADSSHSHYPHAPPIRSRSLDAVWSDTETEEERITRGAYVGRLTSTKHTASSPVAAQPPQNASRVATAPMAILPPLIRIHSECFTGETVGSMRCDCGEQLDEAIRLMSQPIAVSGTLLSSATTIPGRGAVVYLRQEGRGIGLLSKIRAYNLQDLGHDTVTANLMLGHQADEREYEAAAAILRDLGLGGGVRLLTNNPDKVLALESEGVRVEQRVPMVPRSWRQRRPKVPDSVTTVTAAMTMVNVPSMDVDEEKDAFMEEGDRFHGAHVDASTLVGGRVVEGAELDKYLRTKVLRMGHMLPLLED